MFEAVLATMTDYQGHIKTRVCSVDEVHAQSLAGVYRDTIYTPVLISTI